MKKFFNNDDIDNNDYYFDDHDDQDNNDEILYTGKLVIRSISDEKVLALIPYLLQDVISSFKKRYLLSENDYELLYDEPRINLYNFIYDEFKHILFDEKYEDILASGISMDDLDSIYLVILEIIESMLFDEDDDE